MQATDGDAACSASHEGLPCRYDDLKSAQDNIDLQTTILSRFDLIFIVKDERSTDRDKMIARHVLEVHRMAGMQPDQGEQERKAGAGCFDVLAGCMMTLRSGSAHGVRTWNLEVRRPASSCAAGSQRTRGSCKVCLRRWWCWWNQ